jgi:hypothetical protein
MCENVFSTVCSSSSDLLHKLCRSDNFYALGCNSTDNTSGGSCSKRFQSDWIGVYKTKYQPALRPLTW